MKYFVFFLLVLFVFLPNLNINAQVGVASGDFNVEMSPSEPGPNQTVTVSLTSYVFNIDTSRINWIVNGVSKKVGRGEKNFSFVTGGLGQSTTLKIVVDTVDGYSTEKTIRIKPAEVDLIWEAEGYTPAFYKGKALFSYQSKINFVAVPHIISASGVEISPKNLVYKWKNNGSVIESASGFGRNKYSLVGSVIARPLNISVEVSDLSGVSVKAEAVVKPIDPIILLYEKNPLYGINFQKTLSATENLNDAEITVIGIPYFFGVQDLNSGELIYKWYINGIFTGNSADQNIEVFRRKEGTSGTSNISLSVEGLDKFLQTARGSFNLKFEDPNGSESGL
jgi:hypothetical protein